MKEKLLKIREDALAALADKQVDPESLRIRFLGKKASLPLCFAQWGSFPRRSVLPPGRR